MTATLSTPKELREKVSQFAKANDLDVKIVEGEPCDIRIVSAGEKVKSRTDTLQAGGQINCAAAWKMAEKHHIPLLLLGALLDLLDIRVRQCCLGCFK